MSEVTRATTWLGVMTAQYSQRLLRPAPSLPRPMPSVRISGVRVQPVDAGLRRPSGSVNGTGEVISHSSTGTGLDGDPNAAASWRCRRLRFERCTESVSTFTNLRS